MSTWLGLTLAPCPPIGLAPFCLHGTRPTYRQVIANLGVWPAGHSNNNNFQWWPVTASPSWPSNSGVLRFHLLNGRHPFVFRYFRGDDMLVESNYVEPLGATPLQACCALTLYFLSF
jgi:hypothetical protein